jgi:hypothetical protein
LKHFAQAIPMKNLSKAILAVLATGVITFGLFGQQVQAAVTFNFQENGSNVNLGPTSTFTEGGLSLTASGFLIAGGTTALYAKNVGPIGGSGEMGLGTASDPTGDNEITTADFVQLTLPTTPPSIFNVALLASVQQGEQAKVYFTTTAGSLTGATLIGTITNADGSVTIPGADQAGFIDITAGSANVLLQSATFTAVPEGSSTIAFLGIGGVALAGIASLRRMVRPAQTVRATRQKFD